ncbi:hypothetical protein [uncultured Psychroserpens sp.]|uniref:hypothetical protein n=1 Tax=uncultured Psychroserpens sp. TaxID=255436 RepID=UPI0026262A71|nr:hypothetical protein [uncultured Psychroserpens sp.]
MKTLCSKICIALLLLTSIGCSEKEIQHDETQLQQITLPVVSEKVNFESIPHYNRIVERLNKLHEKFNNKSALARDGDDEMLSIITEDVLYTQYDSTHTYTFKILREQPQAYVENLVLHYNLDADDYDEYLVQYHVNAEAFLELSTNGLLQSSEQVTITTLDQGFLDDNLVNSGCERVCETIYVTCEWDFHDESNISDWTNCNSYGTIGGPSTYQSCSSICDDTGGEDETIDDGDSGGGGKGDVITNPNTNEPCDANDGSIGVTGTNGECIDVNDWVEDEQSKNQLCGTYNFITIGNASVANISGLGIFAKSSTGDMLSVTFFTPLCVTIPNYNLPLSQASVKFNTAWALTMNEVLTYLNNTQGIFNPTPAAIRTLILEFLTVNLNLIAGIENGVSVVSYSCEGVPTTPAVYCP